MVVRFGMGRTSPLHPPPPPQSSVLPHPLRAIEAVTRREAAVEEFDRARARPRGILRRSTAAVATGARQGPLASKMQLGALLERPAAPSAYGHWGLVIGPVSTVEACAGTTFQAPF